MNEPRAWDEPLLTSTRRDKNFRCADCNVTGKLETFWVCSPSDHPQIVCIHCSKYHRSLGTHISGNVKSLRLDRLKQNLLDKLQKVLDNPKQAFNWLAHCPAYYLRPSRLSFDHEGVKKNWIGAKYDRKQFLTNSSSPYTSPSKEEKENSESEDEILPTEFYMPRSAKMQQVEINGSKVWLVLSHYCLSVYKGKMSSYPQEDLSFDIRKDVGSAEPMDPWREEEESGSKKWRFGGPESSFQVRGLTRHTLVKIVAPDPESMVNWVHWIRQSIEFYTSNQSQKRSFVHSQVWGLSLPDQGAKKFLLHDDVADAEVIGWARKQGGKSNVLQKKRLRWWIVKEHYLYYSAKDISKGGGNPQGHVCLVDAELWIDQIGERAARGTVLLITPRRTFYMYPEELKTAAKTPRSRGKHTPPSVAAPKVQDTEFVKKLHRILYKINPRRSYDFAEKDDPRRRTRGDESPIGGGSGLLRLNSDPILPGQNGGDLKIDIELLSPTTPAKNTRPGSSGGPRSEPGDALLGRKGNQNEKRRCPPLLPVAASQQGQQPAVQGFGGAPPDALMPLSPPAPAGPTGSTKKPEPNTRQFDDDTSNLNPPPPPADSVKSSTKAKDRLSLQPVESAGAESLGSPSVVPFTDGGGGGSKFAENPPETEPEKMSEAKRVLLVLGRSDNKQNGTWNL